MNELIAALAICPDADTLIINVCPKIVEAFENKKITKEDFVSLREEYFAKGIELKLYPENDFNKVKAYQFRQTLYKLKDCIPDK